MNNDIVFIPLGGGQRVGASCYYLRIGESNIILDAGIGIENGIEFNPDFQILLTSFLQSMGQINQIFVSHAHMDHVGYLLPLMKQATHSSVYMTEITKNLAEYQLYDKLYLVGRDKEEDYRLAAKGLLERIATVCYMKTMDFKKYKVTFYPAGHIPGAMMMLFETRRRKILYTGDYSLNSTSLTQGCILPEGLDIDTVIMCGLHAKHPGYKKRSDVMFEQVNYVLKTVGRTAQSIKCKIPQLSKGIEFLKLLNDWNSSAIPIYLDKSVMNMVSKMEGLSVPVLNSSNRIMTENRPEEPHIYLTSDKYDRWEKCYKSVKIDFSLHEDFAEMKSFIKKINPKQAVIVHCGKEYSVFDQTIEQEVMRDGDCRTQFIFAEENEIYQL